MLVRVGNLATRKHFGPERVNGPATENHSADALMSGAEHVEALLKHKAAATSATKTRTMLVRSQRTARPPSYCLDFPMMTTATTRVGLLLLRLWQRWTRSC